MGCSQSSISKKQLNKLRKQSTHSIDDRMVTQQPIIRIDKLKSNDNIKQSPKPKSRNVILLKKVNLKDGTEKGIDIQLNKKNALSKEDNDKESKALNKSRV